MLTLSRVGKTQVATTVVAAPRPEACTPMRDHVAVPFVHVDATSPPTAESDGLERREEELGPYQSVAVARVETDTEHSGSPRV